MKINVCLKCFAAHQGTICMECDTATPKFLYRYHDMRHAAPLDEWDNPIGAGVVRIHLVKFKVNYRTPKGVRLIDGKFVLLEGRKRYAYPTEQLALESFIARKTWQLSHLAHRVDQAEQALKLAKEARQK